MDKIKPAPPPPAEKDDPFADCILTKMVRAGEIIHYSYPENGLPEVAEKSAPAWSGLLHAMGKEE